MPFSHLKNVFLLVNDGSSAKGTSNYLLIKSTVIYDNKFKDTYYIMH